MFLVTVQKHNLTVGTELFTNGFDANERVLHWRNVYGGTQKVMPNPNGLLSCYISSEQRVAIMLSKLDA